jgi:hypothetical protein
MKTKRPRAIVRFMPLMILILGFAVIATVAPLLLRRRAASRTSGVVLLTERELELAVRRRLYGEPQERA